MLGIKALKIRPFALKLVTNALVFRSKCCSSLGMINFKSCLLMSLASIVILSSAALAQGPVYGSPVGHGGGPGNAPGPVYGSPVYHGNPPTPAYPTPPVYSGPSYPGHFPGNDHDHSYPSPSYPSPYYPSPSYPAPSYPGPSYPSSYPSSMNGPCTIFSNSFGNNYSVTNAYGQMIGSTFDYYQAYQIAQSAQNTGSCSYINNQTNNRQNQNFCQIMPGGNAYGQSFYRVIDRNGRILRDSCNYQDAQYTVQTDSRCFQ